MRILELCNCPLVESQASGYVALRFARGLRERGHEVDLFGPESFEPARFLRKGKSYRQALGFARFALRRLRGRSYDVVAFSGAESWLAARLLRNRRGLLMLSRSNGLETHMNEAIRRHIEPPDSRRWYHWDQSPLFERAFTAVAGLVVPSESDRQYALGRGYQDEAHVVTVEPCLPQEYLDLTNDLRREAVIGYCGSWLPLKGTTTLQADLPRVLREFAHARALLIGVGPAFRKERVFPADVLSRIDCVPFVEDKAELGRLYASVSILAAPSIYESFGLARAEAMAWGCALVSTRTGFAAGLGQGEEALLMDGLSSPHLYEALARLLRDDALRRRLAEAGRRRAQRLRWPDAIRRLETTYASWLEERRGAAGDVREGSRSDAGAGPGGARGPRP
jgi:glycosyltransferase involved in cell wall biosynthesis